MCSLFLLPANLSANGNAEVGACVPSVRVTTTKQLIRLEARTAPLDQVLDEIASETHVPIHRSTLTQQRVSVTCTEPTIERVMECLLGSSADFIVRYAEGPTDAHPRRPAEFWLLTAGLDGDQAPAGQRHSNGCGTATLPQEQASGMRKTPADFPQVRSNQSAALLEMASAEDPIRRAQGLSRLSFDRDVDEEIVRKTLESALSDADAAVRAQAVAGLARRGGVGTAAMLREALQDRDPAVRLMAVSTTEGNIQGTALLQEALADSNSTVRELAKMKLEALRNQGMPN